MASDTTALITGAGSGIGRAFAAAPAEWDRVVAVDVFGVVKGLRRFAPLMLER